MAAAKLLQAIEGGTSSTGRLLLPCDLVIRQSTGARPASLIGRRAGRGRPARVGVPGACRAGGRRRACRVSRSSPGRSPAGRSRARPWAGRRSARAPRPSARSRRPGSSPPAARATRTSGWRPTPSWSSSQRSATWPGVRSCASAISRITGLRVTLPWASGAWP